MAMMLHLLWIWNLEREELPRPKRLVAGKSGHIESPKGEFADRSKSIEYVWI
jgi:hypothetical protein